MHLSPLSEVQFDEADANLFLVDDFRLRADALKHSVLPRLSRLMHEAIGRIRTILKIEALEDSIISQYPNFRTKRETELSIPYDSAFVGLGGKRSQMWNGFRRRDGKPVQILPFRFAFVLTKSGINVLLQNGWLKGLADESFQSLLQFHVDNESEINALCFEAGMRPATGYGDGLRLLSPISDQYKYRQQNRLFDNCYFGHTFHFPVREIQIRELVDSFLKFFPVYDSYIQLAKGTPHRLHELWECLSDWLESEQPKQSGTSMSHELSSIPPAFHAERRVRTLPAVRWQTFQRDGWKCVSCGLSAKDDVILHVDHIVPRSLGGRDELSNYQTLCQACNLGKSNRHSTSLRRDG